MINLIKLCKLLTILGALCFVVGCQQTPKKESKPKAAKPITLYFVRHGKTMLNTTDRSQGWIDAPLTPGGITVAEQLGKGLHEVRFDAVYSSDSGRAIETATLILKNNGQKKLLGDLKEDKRLREFNFGTYEGMPNEEMWTAIAKKQGTDLAGFKANMVKMGFIESIKEFANTLHELDAEKLEALSQSEKTPASQVSFQGEDYQTVVDRATASVQDIIKTAEEKGQTNILVTSHGMTIAALVNALDDTKEVSSLKNASVCKVSYKDGKFTVQSVNDLSYVEKGAKKSA